jgi:hypothetical protein
MTTSQKITKKLKPTTKTRANKKLNDQQIEILQILYKFRFATTELIVQYQELESAKYTHTRLKLLIDKEYIARKYDGQYKIHGKHAIYYLLPKGIRTLKEDKDLNTQALNGMYKDGIRTEEFMDRCLGLFKLYLKFNQLYGDKLNFYSKNELVGSPYFARPLPDAYLKLKTSSQGIRQFVLEVIEVNTPIYTIRRRINRFIDGAPSSFDPDLILFVCENSYLERQVQRLVSRLINRTELDDEIKIYATTAKALFGVQNWKTAIWSDVTQPDELFSLNS